MHSMAVSKCCTTDEFCSRALFHSAEFNFSWHNFETNLVNVSRDCFCLHRNRWLGNIFLLLFEIISCGWTAVTFDCFNILLCIVSPVSKVSWRYQRWLGNVLNKNAWIRVLFMEMHPRYFLYGVLWYFGILNVMYRFYL